MKEHIMSSFINELRDTAVKHEGCQSLREAICGVVRNYVSITPKDDVMSADEARNRTYRSRSKTCNAAIDFAIRHIKEASDHGDFYVKLGKYKFNNDSSQYLRNIGYTVSIEGDWVIIDWSDK